MSEDLLTAEQLAEKLQVSTRWVWRHRDKIPHINISPKIIRFTQSGVEEWLNKNIINSEGG